MKKIRTLIVDDESLARKKIRTLVEGEHDLEIIGECSNGLKAVAAIQKQTPDLIFLDVQMPGMDGFGVLEAIGTESMPAIIFVTAYDQYALRAFDVHALDYLLKPFDRVRFQTALERAKMHILRERSGDFNMQLQALLNDFRSGRKYLERLVVKSGGRVFFLKAEEIDWIDAADNYVHLHAGGGSHLLRETMNGLEAKLDPAKFLRIHRSTIVNIEKIKELRPSFHGEYIVILKNGAELTLSRSYRDRLQELLGNQF
jgi:two-component system, LytTR family, response regulator